MRPLLPLLFLACSSPEPASPAPVEDCPVEELVQLAGNAPDDTTRFEHLLALQDCVDHTDPMANELALLMPILDKWTYGMQHWVPGEQPTAGESGYLAGFFAFTTWPGTEDTYPPQPALDSPLHPVWALYRGRMLIWTSIENGFLVEQYHEDGRAAMTEAATAFPDNPLWGMYLDQPIPWAPLEHHSNAPQWAVDQREALTKLADSIAWWVETRQAPDGQFGGGWGDDVELWRRWAPVLLGFEHPETRAAWTLLSEELWQLDRMAAGYSDVLTDVEHSGEDSADTLTPMQQISPDPLWSARSADLVDLAESRWWGTNDLGQLQFMNTHLSSAGVSDNAEYACDTPYHTRALQPAFLTWQHTQDPLLGARLTPWLDTWVAAAATEANGKPAGILPAAIRWPDGALQGSSGGAWQTPTCHAVNGTYAYPAGQGMLMRALVLAHAQTGDEAYLAPLDSLADLIRDVDTGSTMVEGTATWAADEGRKVLREGLSKHWLLTGEQRHPDLIRSEGGAMAQLLLDGDRTRVEADLATTAAAFGFDEPAWTSEVRFTDRFSVFHRRYAMETNPDLPRADLDLLYETVTGDLEDPNVAPAPAALWHTDPTDLAILVTSRGPDQFSAELYAFDAARDLSVTLFDVTMSGDWRLDCGPADSASTWLGATPTLDLHLPANTLCLLDIN